MKKLAPKSTQKTAEVCLHSLYLVCNINEHCDVAQIFGVICNKLPAPGLMTRVPRTALCRTCRGPAGHVASHLPTIRHFLRWLGHNETQWDHVQQRNTSSISTRHHYRGSSVPHRYFQPKILLCVTRRRWGVFSAQERWASWLTWRGPGPMGAGRGW